MKTIHATAPATVANVSCGFDILGFAMTAPCDEVILTFNSSDTIRVTSIEGDAGRLPREANRNTSSVAIQAYLDAIGEKVGVDLVLKKGLPLGSGMGSSAASAAAALVAINRYFGDRLSRKELVPFAMEAERIACGSAHADNVAPSLMGGVVLIRDYAPLDVIAVPVQARLYCTLVHPHLELRTEDSRKVLKSTLTLKEAITQNGNAAGFMVGLMSADYELIGRCLKDVIAEPTRSLFIPGFENVKQVAKDAGALGSGISGSGPTLFALSKDERTANRVGQAMRAAFANHALPSDLHVSEVNPNGAQVILD